MFIDNARWDGVPFLLKAGKALHSKRAEIRVQFRHVPGNLYKGKMGADLDNATNELVRLSRHCTLHRLLRRLLNILVYPLAHARVLCKLGFYTQSWSALG